MPSRIPPAALVSTTVRQPAAAAVRTPCTTGVDAVALVEVGAPEQHEHAAVADRDRPDRAAVPVRRRRDEPGQVGHRDLVRAASPMHVGGRPPARPEYDGDVVVVDPARAGQVGGGATGRDRRGRGRSCAPPYRRPESSRRSAGGTEVAGERVEQARRRSTRSGRRARSARPPRRSRRSAGHDPHPRRAPLRPVQGADDHLLAGGSPAGTARRRPSPRPAPAGAGRRSPRVPSHALRTASSSLPSGLT